MNLKREIMFSGLCFVVAIIGATIFTGVLGLLYWWNNGAYLFDWSIHALMTATLIFVGMLGAHSNDEPEGTR